MTDRDAQDLGPDETFFHENNIRFAQSYDLLPKGQQWEPVNDGLTTRSLIEKTEDDDESPLDYVRTLYGSAFYVMPSEAKSHDVYGQQLYSIYGDRLEKERYLAAEATLYLQERALVNKQRTRRMSNGKWLTLLPDLSE